MKEYKNLPEKEPQIVSDAAVAVAYEVAPPQQYPTAVMEFKIPRDANGKPVGYTLDEVFSEVDHDLSEFYGVDFMKLTRMLDSGVLSMDEVTNEMLLSPKFKYEPYPGFKPKPLPEDFVPYPSLTGIFEDEE
ncbi:MAG: hypothetical protein LBN93_11025 [Candidatus Symbiothrix sp.]|jgi:hypothetical protein|nr:hypothetical protein [Candidatus Symbiothrix sp.]